MKKRNFGDLLLPESYWPFGDFSTEKEKTVAAQFFKVRLATNCKETHLIQRSGPYLSRGKMYLSLAHDF
jgi:hypothetical protein